MIQPMKEFFVIKMQYRNDPAIEYHAKAGASVTLLSLAREFDTYKEANDTIAEIATPNATYGIDKWQKVIPA